MFILSTSKPYPETRCCRGFVLCLPKAARRLGRARRALVWKYKAANTHGLLLRTCSPLPGGSCGRINTGSAGARTLLYSNTLLCPSLLPCSRPFRVERTTPHASFYFLITLFTTITRGTRALARGEVACGVEMLARQCQLKPHHVLNVGVLDYSSEIQPSCAPYRARRLSRPQNMRAPDKDVSAESSSLQSIRSPSSRDPCNESTVMHEPAACACPPPTCPAAPAPAFPAPCTRALSCATSSYRWQW